MRSITKSLGVGLWLTVTTVIATTVIPPTFEELAERAELVFIGEAIDSRSEWRTTGSDRVILTFITFKTAEVLKGTAGASVTLQFLGGTVDGVKMEVSGIPQIDIGDRVILFVENNGAQFCPLVGIFHGKFGLRTDQDTGREIVLLHDGTPLREVAEIGRGEGVEFGPVRAPASTPSDQNPLSLQEFSSMLRDRLGGSAPEE